MYTHRDRYIDTTHIKTLIWRGTQTHRHNTQTDTTQRHKHTQTCTHIEQIHKHNAHRNTHMERHTDT